MTRVPGPGRAGRPIAILGHGVLASAVARRLDGLAVGADGLAVGADGLAVGADGLAVGADGLGSCAAALAVSGGWPGPGAAPAATVLRGAGIPWLNAHVEAGEAVVGPAVMPGLPGCPQCVELRRERASATAGQRRALRESVGRTPPPPLPAFAAAAIADLVVEELTPLALGEPPPRTFRSFVVVRLDTLACSTHHFLPDTSCPSCGALPQDSADAASLSLVPRPKASPAGDRAGDLRALGPALLDTYVDGRAGMVRQVRQLECFGLAVASAPVGWRDRVSADYGTGRTLDHQTSGYAAVLEALERYSGLGPGGRRTAVRASYTELAGQAADPRTFGLYPDDWYDQPDFAYRRFDPDEPADWVWAHSFRRGGPVLVPETLAYYGRPRHAVPGPAYEISNGCAVGSCLEEAVLHGILEVAERDAFLMTWYGRLPVPELDVCAAADRRLPLLTERVKRHSGLAIRLFDTTVEQGIPTCWALAVPAPPASAPIAALCSAGAGLGLEQACVSAVTELATMLVSVPVRYTEDAERVDAMVADPGLVRTMRDHGSLYCDPRTTPRLGFLLARQERVGFGHRRIAGHPDLREDVMGLVGRYAACGLDVIVVNQTTPELAATGLSCVKVLIPGTLPMTFGHRYRRVHGLPRVLTVPHLLGYHSRPLRPDELNQHPHPFP